LQDPISKKPSQKRAGGARHWWLTPVILATQEDGSLRPAQENSLRDPISKIPITKGAGGVVKVKALSSSPSTANK
jgi:hypothetical protein